VVGRFIIAAPLPWEGETAAAIIGHKPLRFIEEAGLEK